ncbi:phage holin family protein [Pedobacter sp.]|uniref:phage holin family protein n=1 Tax=Pedobacter sp. TaxID=1411316 RepID=UPI00396C3EDD
MKTFFERLLQTFDYESAGQFLSSLAPSSKYKLTIASTAISLFFPFIDRVFGLDVYAFGGLVLVFIAELTSGLIAANIRKETFSSMKLSRFTFKVAYYLILIAVPYVMSVSFRDHGRTAAATVFDWLHLFLLAQIILENIVSILENVAVISGKDKTHWIAKIQTKINELLK